jgi:hypothetical protein
MVVHYYSRFSDAGKTQTVQDKVYRMGTLANNEISNSHTAPGDRRLNTPALRIKI